MAGFNLNDVDKYGGESLANFFTLADDGDSATVRFMYDTLDDIQGYAIHTIKNGDKEITISCLRNYDEEISNCPLCANKNFQKARLYLSLYNEDANEIQIWTRGKQIVPEIMKTFMPIQDNVCGGRVKITRKGAKGDKYTKYIMELIDNDGLTLEELIENVGEPTNPMGTLIKDYSFDELTNYVNTGKLPDIEIEQPTQVNVAYRGNNFNNNNTNNNSFNRGSTNANPIRRNYVPGGNNSFN